MRFRPRDLSLPEIMKIQVNGQPLETRAQTVAQLLEELGFFTAQSGPTGLAVAVNQSVVRRSIHAEFPLGEGDQIEIIRAVQGG